MMNNVEEKRCPLCAEEMDWTDQQFTPCKCGYQICVWCWHHIIDMAEKDRTEGRCPACRTIYEKEKIVAMQANCERTMTKICSRKAKPPKPKPKANEVKSDLTNVRVMQRKMAYVIGLPLSLADEDILVRKEYFGQYGKVTKVSLSRTAGGAIQQFANDTCSVYITYSKEEEALRCIQLVHGFVLEGRFLRASFGTAKYCHAWLKNMPCNNHACLYLHNIGADEDSFGKDEVAAFHTRSRVQQIVGSINDVVKRSGNVLPPPIDSICSSSNTFADRPTVRNDISDATHVSLNIPLSSNDKGANATAHKMTTFVDVVGRPNCGALEKDGYISEDLRISDLSSELSSVTINGDNQAGENNPDNPSFLSDVQDSNDRHNRDYFGHPSYTTATVETSSDPALLQKETHSVNSFTGDRDLVNSHENDASIPIRYIDSVLTDSSQEMKFQNSAKSDRIYRCSNSFSNEEIVEHLRRIDNGGDLNNDKENPVLDALESCIISNIKSIGLDSFEDSLAKPTGLPEFLDETDGLGGSSWSSINSDQSGNSLVRQDGFLNQNQMAGSALPEYWDNKEQYLCRPQYHPVHRSQSLAPPSFSRNTPPGFSLPSGLGSTHGSSFFDSSQTNNLKSPFDWLLMQQSNQESRFSQLFPSRNISTQREPSHMMNSGVDDVYNLHQNRDHQSFFTQAYGNGHMLPGINGYRNSVDVAQQQRNCEEHQGNENYFPGYGNSMFDSSDVYARVFGL